jgi:hypothetical protein
LQSAGTKTVKLHGRARNITFHVFDPQHVEDVLDRDLVTVWREQDAATAAENRRRAAGKAAMKGAQRRGRGLQLQLAMAPMRTRTPVCAAGKILRMTDSCADRPGAQAG